MRRLCTILIMLFLMISASSYTIGQSATPTSATSEAMWEDFNPANFTNPTKIDNQWLPLKPGTQSVYQGNTDEDGKLVGHRLVFIVTGLTKVIADILTVVVWDQDFADGQLEESELSFYAQDNDGNVWLMGEYPEVYKDGKLVENPSWIHGFQDAHAGIIVMAKSEAGSASYSEGWGPAVNWSDRAQADQIGQETCVPANCYKDVLVVKEFSVDEPTAFQFKYYAPGVGNVRVDWGGDDTTKEKLELVKVEELSANDLASADSQSLTIEKRAYEINKDVYGQTAPSVSASGVTASVSTTASTATPMSSPESASGPKNGHWEGIVSFGEGDNTIAFDVMPEGEIDNIELQLVVNGTQCTAEVDLAPINSDGTFTLEPAANTNGILGKFGSANMASGTVTIHDCGGNPVPASTNKDSYDWSAAWASDKVGFDGRLNQHMIA